MKEENALEGAVEKQNARLADEAPHLGVVHVFVDHDTLQHSAVFDLSTGDFLHFCVAFDVDIWPAVLSAGEASASRKRRMTLKLTFLSGACGGTA
jgi:hypothetical protein